MQPQLQYKDLPLADSERQRGDYVLGRINGALWIGVRFGNRWRPARRAGCYDLKFFH